MHHKRYKKNRLPTPQLVKKSLNNKKSFHKVNVHAGPDFKYLHVSAHESIPNVYLEISFDKKRYFYSHFSGT